MRKILTAAVPAITLAAVLILAGCGDGDWIEIEPGLSYADSVVGTGAAVQADDFVEIHLVGWVLEDGEKSAQTFADTYARGEPTAVAIGRNQLIEGCEKGIVGMRVGGKRSLVVGPELAYGATGSPPRIPPDATLFFDIELVGLPEVEVEILEAGDGPVTEVGDQISVRYTGWFWEDGAKGSEFESSRSRDRPYMFTLGMRMVIPGWDMALTGMAQGTRARLIVPPVMGYGKEGKPPTIPADATLCFEVEVLDIKGKPATPR